MTIRKWGSEQVVFDGGDPEDVQILALPGGGFVVVWGDDAGLGPDDSVLMQRYDNLGNKVGGVVDVAANTAGDQEDPSLALLSNGNFVVAWKDESGANNDIKVRTFAANGTPQGGDVIVAGFAGNQNDPDLAGFSGSFAVAYEDDQSGSNDIHLRLFNGVVPTGVITVATGANDQVDARVATLATGSVAVAWRDTTANQVFFQLVNNLGVPVGGNVSVVDAPVAISDIDVLALRNGNFLITWTDERDVDGSAGLVRGRLFNSFGTAAGFEFTVSTFNGGSQTDCRLVALPDGGFAAVYQSDGEIRGQVFNLFGERRGPEFIVNTVEGTDDPDITVLADGRLVVAYEGDGSMNFQIIDPRDGMVSGTAGNDVLLGHDAENDEITALAGNDTLNGLAGSDFMYGGAGNDTYGVESAGDRVFEIANQGTDTVRSLVSFTLGANVENLVLLGAGALQGTGNALVNSITGNAGANRLDGVSGLDTLTGLNGNDTYLIDSTIDTVVEAAGAAAGAADHVIFNGLANQTIVLAANVELLTLAGAATTRGTGNAVNNTMNGNAAANILSGAAGNDVLNGAAGGDTLVGGAGVDTLVGGAGNDSFFFNVAVAAANRDVITDFSNAAGNNDTIRLENLVMPALGAPGALDADAFFAGAAAQDAEDRIVYNQATGILLFDNNGNAAGGSTQLATLTNKPVLAAADFLVI